MPRLTLETLLRRLDELAREADIAAEMARPDEGVPGESWVAIDGIATDLADLARDMRSDLMPTAATR